MSNESNTRLFERALEAMSYWSGTIYEKLIQRDLDNDDLELLAVHVKEAEQAMFNAEFSPELAELTDDEVADLATSAWTNPGIPVKGSTLDIKQIKQRSELLGENDVY